MNQGGKSPQNLIVSKKCLSTSDKCKVKHFHPIDLYLFLYLQAFGDIQAPA